MLISNWRSENNLNKVSCVCDIGDCVLKMKHFYYKCCVLSKRTSFDVYAKSNKSLNWCRFEGNCNYSDSTYGKVLVSGSNNIYYNLALEDWFYKHNNFSKESLLLLWRNQPCVVIGRHQNPWVECNLSFLKENNVLLARRNSGGGAVYHDMGNLNCTFFTDRKKYNRRANLQMIVDGLKETWGFNLGITSREDIFLEEKYKISGTAAKLGNPNAYHHCTVLFNINKSNLDKALGKKIDHMESKATPSVSSTVSNLKDLNSNVDFWPLVETISSVYAPMSQNEKNWSVVQPCEESFPGIEKIYSQLMSWQWIYGRTPRFFVKRQFAIPRSIFIHRTLDSDVSGNVQYFGGITSISGRQGSPPFTIEVGMEVYHARIEKLTVSPNSFLPNEILENLTELVVGHLFNDNLLSKTLSDLMNSFKADLRFFNKIKFISKCLCTLVRTS